MYSFNNLLNKSANRFELWASFINENSLTHIAEVGVFRGDFASHVLSECPSIIEYLMIDPWKNLKDWNKPANVGEDTFEAYYRETLDRTDFAADKRKVLRGRTREVIQQVTDESLDFVYVDGDHTLKGITVDLISLWPKVKAGGFIAGDDLSATIWQHDARYEPSMVFPFAVYFAEAVNAPVYALPMNQFLIAKVEDGFTFNDLTPGNDYKLTDLRSQFKNKPKSASTSGIVSKFINKLNW